MTTSPTWKGAAHQLCQSASRKWSFAASSLAVVLYVRLAGTRGSLLPVRVLMHTAGAPGGHGACIKDASERKRFLGTPRPAA